MLKPWDTVVSFYGENYGNAGARLARLEPSLLVDHRLTPVGSVSQEIKDEIDRFHRSHNAISPNKKDLAKQRHPSFPSQCICCRRIYRMETWNELWVAFKKYAPHIAEKIAVKDRPNECPSLLWKEAPWELVKGTDSSCLCTNCEGTNALRRGQNKACAILLDIQTAPDIPEEVDGVAGTGEVEGRADLDEEDSDDGDSDRSDDSMDIDHEHSGMTDENVERLANIITILQMNSKTDMCKACLQPCLGGNNLEDAKLSCERGECVR